MRVYVTNIQYNILDCDVESGFDLYLVSGDFKVCDDSFNIQDFSCDDKFTKIAIDKSRVTTVGLIPGDVVLIGGDQFIGFAGEYELISEDEAYAYMKQIDFYDYAELADNLIYELDDAITFDLTPEEDAELREMSNFEAEEYIADKVSDATDYLVSDFDYEIEE